MCSKHFFLTPKIFDSTMLTAPSFRSGRGNVFLGNAATLAKGLHRDIVYLGKRLEKAAATEEAAQENSDGPAKTAEEREVELFEIIRDIKGLLARIDSDIPLLQLAITASGESLSTALPPSISPSRLLQASMCLVVGDTQFSGDPHRPVQIGPSFTLSLYLLFLGHSAAGKVSSQTGAGLEGHDTAAPYGLGPGERKPIWQEVLHKARVRICRTPPGWEFHHDRGFIPLPNAMKKLSNIDRTISRNSPLQKEEKDEFSYFLEIIEDLDDGRAHEDQACTAAFDGISCTGLKEAIPIYQISKLFYTDSGRILNIGNQNDFENSSVLLLKRDPSATSPTRAMAHMEPEEDEEEEEESSSGSSEEEDEQDDIDRQLREESTERADMEEPASSTEHNDGRWVFPSHLDPEWLALEVFTEDDNEQHESDSDSSDEDDDDDASHGDSSHYDDAVLSRPVHKQRKSVDSHLTANMCNLTIASPNPTSRGQTAQDTGDSEGNSTPSSQSRPPHVAQSPYGSVTSSMSLLEMLIRLTSLQQFQQTSHLAIPDHILTFFLEETSATGLRGEARWQAKRAAKQKMGFDPFTDTPTKQETPKGQRNGML